MKGDCFCSESADNTEPGCPYIQNRHHEGSHSVSEVSADISKTFRSGCYQSRNGDSDRDPSLVRGGFLRIDRAGFSQGLRVLFHGLLQDLPHWQMEHWMLCIPQYFVQAVNLGREPAQAHPEKPGLY